MIKLLERESNKSAATVAKWRKLVPAIVMVLMWTPTSANQETERLTTSAKLADNFQLEFTVTWLGKNDLQLYEADLPWGTVDRTLIIAVTSGGEVLQRSLPIDDPGPSILVLRSGVAARGSLNLLTLYPQLKRIASTAEVIVFWSYQPRLKAFKAERVGGFVALPVK